MQLKELETHLETKNAEFWGNCHDCKDSVSVLCTANEDGKIVVSEGAIYNPKIDHTEQLFFKCDKCFEKDKTLRNWRPVETYSSWVSSSSTTME